MKKTIIFLTAVFWAFGCMAETQAPDVRAFFDGSAVLLEWDEPYTDNTITAYAVYIDTTTSPEAYTEDLYYTDASVNTAVSRTYYVHAVEYSGVSGTVSAGTGADPYPPENITVSEYNSKVLLEWDEPGDSSVSAYNIYRSTGWGFISPVLIEEKEYLDEGLINGKEYIYSVTAVSDKEGAFSVSLTAKPFAGPGAPVNVSVSASGTDAVVLWDDTGIEGTYAVTEYDVIRQLSGSGPVQATNTTGVLEYEDIGLDAGTRYYYGVIARDSAGNTSPASYTDIFIPGPPSVPSGFEILKVNTAGITLNWDDNPSDENVTGYVVYRNGSEYADSASSGYYDSVVDAGVEYYYSVLAQNSYGPSSLRGNVTAVVKPAVPENISVSAGETETDIDLWWDQNAPEENITIYNIYRGETEGSMAYIAHTNASYYTDENTTAGQMYYYTVEAVSNTVKSNWPDAVSFTALSLPAPPENLSAVSYDSYIHLQWDEPSGVYGITGYAVYRSTGGSEGVWEQTDMTDVSEYYDPDVEEEILYYYKTAAMNAHGAGDFSAPLGVTFSASGEPGPPRNLEIVSDGTGVLRLSWSAPVSGEITAYNIYRSIESMVYSSEPYAETESLSYTDDNVQEDVLYYYRAASVGSILSAYSNEASGTAYIRPQAPGNIFLTNINESVLVSWEAPAADYTYFDGMHNYNIYRSTSPSYEGAHITRTAETYYVDTGTLAGSTYYYGVRTVDSNDNESFEDTPVSIQIAGPKEPPGNLAAKASDGQVLLYWTSINTSGYNIYRKLTISAEYDLIAANLDFDSVSYADSSVTNNFMYEYSVSALTSYGEGPKSEPVEAMPYDSVVIGPEDKEVQYTITGKKDVSLQWNAAQSGTYDVSLYNVFRSSDNGGTYTLLTKTAAGVREYTDAETKWGMQYVYSVRVQDTGGNTDAFYDLLTVELPAAENRMRIYSNLINTGLGEKLRMRYFLSKEGEFKISVHTLSGVHVKTIVEGSAPAGISEDNPYESPDIFWDGTNASGKKAAAGVYLIILEVEGERTINKAAVVK